MAGLYSLWGYEYILINTGSSTFGMQRRENLTIDIVNYLALHSSNDKVWVQNMNTMELVLALGEKPYLTVWYRNTSKGLHIEYQYFVN